MKFNCRLINLSLIAAAIWVTGCATAPWTVTISGQILVSDAGKVQKTGLAPIWIYDATNVQSSANIPLPNFGGRSRADLTRIRDNYPGVLTVCSNYQATLDRAAAAELKYEDLNQKFWNKKNSLNGRTNGPDFDAVQQLGAEAKKASDERWVAVDQSDDVRELIFYWFNVNPGILYAGLPEPLMVAQTDKNGNFNVTLPKSKNILMVAHIQGSLNGRPGHYFWLLPVSLAGTNVIVLNSANVCQAKKESELKPTQVLVLNSGFGLATPRRVRDTRQDWQPY
jgi:hypothetical protein